MPIHGSERMANVRATLWAWLATLTITGTPSVFWVDQERPAGKLPAVMMGVTVPEAWTLLGGHPSGDRAVGASALLTFDLFWRQPASGDDFYQIDRALDDLGYACRNLSLSLQDYASTPNSPTDTGARLRVWDEPQPIALPAENMLLRRQLQVALHWVARTDT